MGWAPTTTINSFNNGADAHGFTRGYVTGQDPAAVPAYPNFAVIDLSDLTVISPSASPDGVASLVASHIGRHIMGITMGLIFSAHSLGGALGSFMGGYLFDLFARYDSVWVISIALALLAALLTVLIKEDRSPEAESALA